MAFKTLTPMLWLLIFTSLLSWSNARQLLLAKDGHEDSGDAHTRRALLASSAVVATDVKSLWSALSNDSISTVLLNGSLTLDTAPPGGTIALKRNVSLQATPELLSAGVKAYVDFRGQNMVVSIARGNTLQFVGLELANLFGLVGSVLTIIRQSPGARIEFTDCVKRRRVGLPTDAALVNMLSASRGGGAAGPQLVYRLSNYTFNTTRSPGVPVRFNNDVVMQLDYLVNVASDSSLAFQGLYFGGYEYSVRHSVYHPDNTVSQSCLDSRPGDECVADYIRQLDAQAAAAQAAPAPADNSGLSTTDTIVIAVVVPVGVVLLAAVVVAVVLARRRRARAATYANGSSGKADVAGSSEPKAAAGAASTTRSSDIFMGFEPGAAPPEWTQQHQEEAAAEFASAAHGPGDADCWDAAPAANGDAAHTDGAANGVAAATDATSPGGAEVPARQTSGRISRAITGGLRPAFATAQWGPKQAGPQAGAALVSSTALGSGANATPASAAEGRPAAGDNSAAYVSDGGAANGNGSHATPQQARQVPQQPAAAATAQGHSNGAAPASGTETTEESVTVQPAEALRPADVAAELARMAREVRMQVKDVAIRIDTVLGTGAFGVVYGGVWQGLPVAVKTVVISASQERRKRALQEAALCQSIVHPNIIATYACELQPIGAPMVASVSSSEAVTTDSGRTGLASMMPQIVDWRLYIIQELADGGPLSKLYGVPDIWPAPSAPHMLPVVALALGIARAVAHLHSKRIIHGDLSPNNVMLKKDEVEPSGYTVKVGDFGLSVMLPQHQSHLSNLRMGTMFYMCPAVILKGQVGPASDVFSLGVILWELYHGRRAGVRTDEGPRYASIFPAFPPSCPRAYVNITLNCLQRQPANRPTADVVAEHLNALLQSLAAGS